MNLAQRIVTASKIVGGSLSADKANKEQNYEYISSDKIMTICGRALVEAGVSVVPSVFEHTVNMHEYETFGKQKRRFDVVVKMNMTLTDGETTMTTYWLGFGCDYASPDKAMYKAITGGHKYFLAKLLNVGAGNEDGEHEVSEETEQKPVKQEVKQAAKPQVYAPPEDAPLMTLETALNVTNSDGLFYGQLDNDKLSNMTIGISKALKKTDLTPEKRSEYELKRDAIKVILAARADAGS